MGLLDKLRSNIAAGTNPNEPLFGGLIPRREVEAPVDRVKGIPSPDIVAPVNSIRRTGMEQVREGIRGRAPTPTFGGMVGSDSNPGADILNRAKSFGEQIFAGYNKPGPATAGEALAKAGIESPIDTNLKREQMMMKNDLDYRKQALEEWKIKNPEGELKVAEDGKIHVVDKRTGKTIDTGLSSGDLTEEQKLNIQHKNATDLLKQRQSGDRILEEQRQRGREALDNASYVNPTQQVAAKKDVANELLNDPRFSWMNKGPDVEDNVVTITSDGVVIKRQAENSANNPAMNKKIKDANTMIDLFEQELKTKTDEMINRTRGGGRTAIPRSDGKIEMIDPSDGSKIFVPAGEVEQARAAGAIMPGEETAPKDNRVIKSVPPDAVADDIEIFYNDKGKVAAMRNRKNPNISSFEK